MCLKVYSKANGLEDEYHSLYDTGPLPYGEIKNNLYKMLTVTFVGMKAECRQFAVQTHHIDPHN